MCGRVLCRSANLSSLPLSCAKNVDQRHSFLHFSAIRHHRCRRFPPSRSPGMPLPPTRPSFSFRLPATNKGGGGEKPTLVGRSPANRDPKMSTSRRRGGGGRGGIDGQQGFSQIEKRRGIDRGDRKKGAVAPNCHTGTAGACEVCAICAEEEDRGGGGGGGEQQKATFICGKIRRGKGGTDEKRRIPFPSPFFQSVGQEFTDEIFLLFAGKSSRELHFGRHPPRLPLTPR